jgi:hypothetical protein
MLVVVVILICAAVFFFFRAFFGTADAMILKHAMHENEKAKEKIFNAVRCGNVFLAKECFQEEKGRLKHHLSIAKLSIYEIETILESFDAWFNDIHNSKT